MKRLFIFALFVFSIFVATAQRFEWAKGYTVESNRYRSIVGGVTDSLGNLYILGNCDATSVWDGNEDIIPSIHKSTKNLLNDILIAKISPEGEMVWKKVIFGNNSNSCLPYDIKKIGDTAFACLVNVGLPSGITNYCYYLDTFMVGYSDYPIPLSATSDAHFTALITFNFSGEVIEQHFIQVSYIDTTGNDYRTYSGGPVYTSFFFDMAFDVDAVGNIYIGRITHTDNHTGLVSVQDGSAIGLKFWVDQRCVGTVYVNDGYHPGWVPQILKFSPHFDTLLACRYLVQKSPIDDYVSGYIPVLKCDASGSIYFSTRHEMYGTNSSNVITLDSMTNIMFRHSEKSAHDVSYLVKLDSFLTPKWVICLDDSILDERQVQMGKYFHDIDFDYDSNLLFLSASVGRSSYLDTVTNYSLFTYRGTPLPLRNDACVLSFYNSDSVPLLHSCAVVPSVSSQMISITSQNTLLCENNRIFLQSQYDSYLNLPTQTIRFTDIYNSGFAMIMFDYSGRVIDGIDYGIESRASNYPGPIVAHDSVLYLCNLLKTSAQFGDISFPVYGETNVIAKYVDTAFMHLYVRPTLGTSTAAAVAPRVYPVPATDRLHFDCPAGGVPTAVAAISLSGWRMPLTATASSADVSCLAPGVYLLEITTAKDKYYTKFVKQ